MTFSITADRLAADGACAEQVALVRKLFGDGPIKCHKTNLRRAAKAGANISWLARYIPAGNRKQYYEAIAPARKQYPEAIAPARKQYDEAITAALAIALAGETP